MGHGCSKSPSSEAEGEGRTGDKREGRMGVSASAAAAAHQSSPLARKGRIHSYFLEDNNNNSSGKKMEAFETSDLLKRIESLEQELKCKDKEITSLQVTFPELILLNACYFPLIFLYLKYHLLYSFKALNLISIFRMPDHPFERPI